MSWSTWGPDEWIAAASVANAVLVLVLVAATIFYAIQTLRTVNELTEARVAQSLPVLHWLQPGVGARSSGEYVEVALRLTVANVGPGPARLLTFTAYVDTGEQLFVRNLAAPWTMRPDHNEELEIGYRLGPGKWPGERTVTVRSRYTDLDGLRTYETRAIVKARWTAEVTSMLSANLDERSPAQRRV